MKVYISNGGGIGYTREEYVLPTRPSRVYFKDDLEVNEEVEAENGDMIFRYYADENRIEISVGVIVDDEIRELYTNGDCISEDNAKAILEYYQRFANK